MMRKYIDRIIPRYAQLPLAMCGVTQGIAYFATKQVRIFDAMEWSTALDAYIDVHPEWVTVYVAAYIYWVVAYIAVCRAGEKNCRLLCRADYLAKAVAAMCFVLMPTTLPREPLTEGGAFEWALNIIYTLDTPYNLFPSMHCLLSWLPARELMDIKEYPWAARWGAVAFSILVFASTVYTGQHVVVDIAGGVALAEIVRFASHRIERLREHRAEVNK